MDTQDQARRFSNPACGRRRPDAGFLIALLLLFPGAADAADWDIPSDALQKAFPKDCDSSSEAGLYTCAMRAFEQADSELNAVWRRVLASIDAHRSDAVGELTPAQAAEWKNDLIAAQKAWNSFKDEDCDGARSFEYWGGSARALAVLSCKYEYTVARTRDLKIRYLKP